MSTQLRVKLPPLERRTIDIAPHSLSGAQEAVPVPRVCGVQPVAVVWVSAVYNEINRPSKAGATGAKK